LNVALLEIQNLTVRFGGLTSLSELDFRVEPGSLVALIGPNGAGKTTAFNVITGVYTASGGEVRFGEHQLTRLTPQRIYEAGITRTFQRSRLALPLSIKQVEQLGGHALLYGTLPDGETSVTAQCAGQHAARPGDLVTLYAPPAACHYFDADGLRLRAS